MNWEINKTEKVHENNFFSVHIDSVTDFAGNTYNYHYIKEHDGVVIIPIMQVENGFSFVMVSQYRHPTSSFQIEFPKGSIDSGEGFKDAASRELFEETGMKTDGVKYLHTLLPSTGLIDAKTHIFLANVSGEPNKENLEEFEKGSQLEPMIISSDDLMKKVVSNEVSDSTTLAALAVLMMQSKLSKQYLSI